MNAKKAKLNKAKLNKGKLDKAKLNKSKNKRYDSFCGMFIYTLIIMAALLTCLTGCEKGEPSYKQTDVTMNSDIIRPIGRTCEREGVLWFSLSGSGVEFKVSGRKCELTLAADSMAGDAVHAPRYALYLDGERLLDSVMKKKSEKAVAFESESKEEHTVRLVKLSETLDSTMGLAGITCDEGATIEPTRDKSLKIEFIGDSLTCGYGIDGSYGDSYSTSSEDCTKAFAIRTAEMLDAEYSLFAISGYGVISGYSPDGHKAEDMLIRDYYTKLGKSEGHFASGINPSDIEWDFSFEPDVVVINLGTNDDSYTQGDAEREEEFTEGYSDLIKFVREKNPEAIIVCALGLMRQDLCGRAEQAVARYKNSSGDSKVYYLTLDEQSGEPVVDGHPGAASHEHAAEQLSEFIPGLL